MTAPLLLTLAMLLPGQTLDARTDGPPADKFTPEPSWRKLDDSNALFFDAKDKRLILRARVCLREGYLEHLLCKDKTKEHESVLATTAAPRMIHAGLLLTGAEAGHPVRYRPRFEPPSGSKILVTVEWTEDGKVKTADARDFIVAEKSKKPLAEGWVFAGSDTFPHPDDPKTILYAADGGDLFTVANFTSSILDVPFASSGNDAERSFMANTAKIPPKNTYVSLILRPAPAETAKKE